MLIPIGTDAPIYYWPFATIALIIANVFVFVLQVIAGSDFDPFMLQFGELNPLQWVSSFFMHADVGHLISNMVFLALFGVITEGKVGWAMFLLIYMACGIAASITIQLIMLGGDSAALGASCAIFGLMAVALFWAPENEIQMVGFIFYRPFHVEASVMMCSFFYLAINFLVAWFTEFEMGTATAHLIGAVFGGVIGYITVVRNMVDCEGFDLISVIQGRRGKARPLTKAQKKQKVVEKEERRSEHRQQINNGKQKVAEYIEQGHYELADVRFSMLQAKNRTLKMPAAWRLEIIKGLSKDKRKTAKTISMMEKYIDEYDELRESMLLNLARLLVTEQQKPRKAIKVLGQADPDALDHEQRRAFNKIARRAKQMIDEGLMELED